jgi:hypothetical protein
VGGEQFPFPRQRFKAGKQKRYLWNSTPKETKILGKPGRNFVPFSVVGR